MNLKIALGMSTGGADLRRIRANYDMSAVTAFPYLNLALCKYSGSLNIAEKRAVSLLVVSLDSGYETEFGCKLGKSLLIGSLSKSIVHICPLVVLTVSRVSKIFSGVADALQLLELHLCVLLLIVGCLEEKS